MDATATPTNPRYARLSISVELVFIWEYVNIIMEPGPGISSVTLGVPDVSEYCRVDPPHVSSELTMLFLHAHST